MENLKLLNGLGVNSNTLNLYQVLCLPENIDACSEQSKLIDAGESVTLSKLLKEEGVKCANSYDLSLNAQIAERRGFDFWLGSIWILDHTAMPLLINVLGRLLGEKIQKKLEASKQLEASKADDLDKTRVHANLKIIDGKVSAEISFHGDADAFLKVLKGINDAQYTSEK